jgi:hypothetical protein
MIPYTCVSIGVNACMAQNKNVYPYIVLLTDPALFLNHLPEGLLLTTMKYIPLHQVMAVMSITCK